MAVGLGSGAVAAPAGIGMSTRCRSVVLVAMLLAIVAVLLPPAAPVALAAGELPISAAATYRIDANDRMVRARVDIRVTNQKPNTVRRTSTGTITTQYYWDRLVFFIQPDARNVRATSGGSTLRTALDTKDGYRQVTIRMPQLHYRQSRSIRLEFELRDGGPRSDSDVRVGEAFATFTAWAWGDPGRSSVRIVMPAGFRNDDGYGRTLRATTDDGRTVLASGTIADPGDWYAVLIADRPGKLTDVRVGPDDERIIIRAWPEDAAWQRQVSTVLEDGVPHLKDLIGLEWPVTRDLTVTEVHTPLLEGYAGIYDPSVDEIRISEDLDAQTILHEASHAWFSHAFIDERWIIEGLAEEYAFRVRTELGLQGDAPPADLDRAAASGFALVDWPPLRRIDDDEVFEQERYGYDASWHVMHQLAAEVGDDGMRRVFEAIDGRRIGYLGDGPAEGTGVRASWRQFLDLVEETGEAPGAAALFREWVVPGWMGADLDTRAEARTAYAALREAGDGWAVPYHVRDRMWAWSFGNATDAMAVAMTVLERRDALSAVTNQLGTEPPANLEARYEAATRPGDLEVVTAEIDARIAAAETLLAARGQLALERTPLAQLGLVGAVPGDGLDAGVAAFRSGDLHAATAGAARTVAMLAGAEALGIERATMIGAGVLAVLLLLLVAVLLLRRRRRGRRLALAATGAPIATVASIGGPADPPRTGDTAGASTTLAPTPDPSSAGAAPSSSASPPTAGVDLD